ncbi:hypothetical protein P170DRAFT_444272 [Aspergillus steynii IBT 23096]|uniref:Acyl-CoA thioesterase II n=1 Tax=Aspergillus steynii IBT 23096 TaxID=1392250 RepID=A0A2I2GH82_9EURO|nr:uncharacterized protein P170DRAFT_444272 [Aspergillus steynii IBT 23096]PLB52238.1 hypothetical protein P170DRAFT_444272 [Aspergillus steynii IBT 23096]
MVNSEAITLSQQIAVHSLSPGCFASVCHPARLGSLTSTAFGGSSLAIAISAAFQQSRRDFHLYSIAGYFIRPANTDRKLFCQIENVRKSKSFETREIRLTQEDEHGIRKICLIALADFHIVEPRSMVSFATAPELITLPETTSEQPLKGPSQASCSGIDLYQDIEKFIEMKPLSPGHGLFHSPIHKQGMLTSNLPPPFPWPIHAERFRARSPLFGEAEQISALAFYMDKGLAYIPALHHGYHPSEADACASLDFSLRFFEHGLNLEEWHYTEQKGFVANHARVYSEGRVWDSKGRLLASMTQQTILRPNPRIKSRF